MASDHTCNDEGHLNVRVANETEDTEEVLELSSESEEKEAGRAPSEALVEVGEVRGESGGVHRSEREGEERLAGEREAAALPCNSLPCWASSSFW